MIQSIQIAKSGLPRKQLLQSELINTFHLEAEFTNCLSKYYRKFWSKNYFFEVMHEGIIIDQNTEYLVIYKNCNPFTIRKCEKEKQIELSFRKAKSKYELIGYVLIRIPK